MRNVTRRPFYCPDIGAKESLYDKLVRTMLCIYSMDGFERYSELELHITSVANGNIRYSIRRNHEN